MTPPVGWADVATKHDLAALEERMDLRFAGVNQRFDSLDERFASIDQRFASIDQRFVSIDQRFASIDQRFADAERHFDARLDDKLAGLRHELLDSFHRDQVTLTWRFIGATGSMFLAFSALVTLVVRL